MCVGLQSSWNQGHGIMREAGQPADPPSSAMSASVWPASSLALERWLRMELLSLRARSPPCSAPDTVREGPTCTLSRLLEESRPPRLLCAVWASVAADTVRETPVLWMLPPYSEPPISREPPAAASRAASLREDMPLAARTLSK